MVVTIIMNPTENEKLGLGLNLIEAYNMVGTLSKYSKKIKSRMGIHIQIVINKMDEVLC